MQHTGEKYSDASNGNLKWPSFFNTLERRGFVCWNGPIGARRIRGRCLEPLIVVKYRREGERGEFPSPGGADLEELPEGKELIEGAGGKDTSIHGKNLLCTEGDPGKRKLLKGGGRGAHRTQTSGQGVPMEP